jgi:hypothetical protein
VPCKRNAARWPTMINAATGEKMVLGPTIADTDVHKPNATEVSKTSVREGTGNDIRQSGDAVIVENEEEQDEREEDGGKQDEKEDKTDDGKLSPRRDQRTATKSAYVDDSSSPRHADAETMNRRITMSPSTKRRSLSSASVTETPTTTKTLSDASFPALNSPTNFSPLGAVKVASSPARKFTLTSTPRSRAPVRSPVRTAKDYKVYAPSPLRTAQSAWKLPQLSPTTEVSTPGALAVSASTGAAPTPGSPLLGDSTVASQSSPTRAGQRSVATVAVDSEPLFAAISTPAKNDPSMLAESELAEPPVPENSSSATEPTSAEPTIVRESIVEEAVSSDAESPVLEETDTEIFEAQSADADALGPAESTLVAESLVSRESQEVADSVMVTPSSRPVDFLTTTSESGLSGREQLMALPSPIFVLPEIFTSPFIQESLCPTVDEAAETVTESDTAAAVSSTDIPVTGVPDIFASPLVFDQRVPTTRPRTPEHEKMRRNSLRKAHRQSRSRRSSGADRMLRFAGEAPKAVNRRHSELPVDVVDKQNVLHEKVAVPSRRRHTIDPAGVETSLEQASEEQSAGSPSEPVDKVDDLNVGSRPAVASDDVVFENESSETQPTEIESAENQLVIGEAVEQEPSGNQTSDAVSPQQAEESDTEHLRNFVKRVSTAKKAAAASTKRRSLASETGSPMSSTNSKVLGTPGSDVTTATSSPKRVPLGERGINTPSPTKQKRKHAGEGHDESTLSLHHVAKADENSAPAVPSEQPKHKRRRRGLLCEIETTLENLLPAPEQATSSPLATAADVGPRRSTRSRTTRIPLGRGGLSANACARSQFSVRSAGAAVAITSASPASGSSDASVSATTGTAARLRAEERELAAVTKTNTRRNKCGAVFPKEKLASGIEDNETEQDDGEQKNSRPIKKKSVRWDETLARYQGETAVPVPIPTAAVPVAQDADADVEMSAASPLAAPPCAAPPTVAGPVAKSAPRESRLQPPKRLKKSGSLPVPAVVAPTPTTAKKVVAASAGRIMSSRRTQNAALNMSTNGTPAPKRHRTRA